MDNEFQAQAEREQKRVMAEQIAAILEIVKGLDEKVAAAVKKEVRVVREELRNLDKLRPLRSPKEEEAETTEEVTDQK